MAFIGSDLSSLGDPTIWHTLYNQYGWTSNNQDPNGWGTVYKYEGREVSGALLDKLSADTQHIWESVQVWNSSSYDIAERTIIAQSNILRNLWGWYGQASKDYPRPPTSAPYVPPTPAPVVIQPTVALPVKPEVQTVLQPMTVSDAGYSIEGSPLNEIDYSEPVQAGFFTPINLLIMSLIGGLSYYVYSKKVSKPNTVSY